MEDNHNHQGFFERVKLVVGKIPKGKVTTYYRIALFLGTKDARKVGFALHSNTDLNIPCHRVVNKSGGLASGYAFGGYEEQRKKLQLEGVYFLDANRVDLEKSLWDIE